MIQRITTVRTEKALEFGFKTPEGNAFWPHMEKWRRHEQTLQKLKAEAIRQPKYVKYKRGYKANLAIYNQQQAAIVKTRAILKRDYDKAKTALAKAYNAPDIRAEYKSEIYALAAELGLSQKDFRIFAAGPKPRTQKSFVLIPAHP